MTIEERYRRVINYFLARQPDAATELCYADPFGLLVAVILSARCTDKRVNMITPALLKRFPDPESMSKAHVSEIFPYIKSCSYPNNKARHLSGMSRMLINDFNGNVPSDPSILQRLPGVGRKTANVVASILFRKPVMAVDTHVFRVSARIGLTRNAKTPLDAENQLTNRIPPDLLHLAHHWLLLHGRNTCKARKPLCKQCGISYFCRYHANETHK
jgi:endonuclease-3